MSDADFFRFIVPFGTHKYFNMTQQDFLDKAPPHRFINRRKALEDIYGSEFVGITTDGTARQGLRQIKDEGAPVEAMVAAVEAFLGLLSPDDKARVLLPLDAREKRTWVNGIPDYNNHGICLDDVPERVRDAAMAVLRAGLSAKGYERTRDVMRLNGYLGDVIGAPKLMGEYTYRLHIWGTPSGTDPWGWQFWGHHLCLTCFVLGGQMTLTPTFMGVEPNHAPGGRFGGASVFQDEELAGLRFVQSLDAGQQRKAILYDSILPGDLPPGRHHPLNGLMMTGAYLDNQVVPYEGISGGDLTAAQRRDLLDLTERYLATLPEGPLRAKMADVERHLDETQFCWAGQTEEDSVFYYRIQSPVTLIEFDHHQGVVLTNPTPERFHIHTIVRTPNGGDYGMDLLRMHYETSPHHRVERTDPVWRDKAQERLAAEEAHARAHAQGQAHRHDHTHDHGTLVHRHD